MRHEKTEVIAALIQANNTLNARFELNQRVTALLLSHMALQHSNPAHFILEHTERMRAALYASEASDRKSEWHDMESALDQISDLARMFLDASGR